MKKYKYPVILVVIIALVSFALISCSNQGTQETRTSSIFQRGEARYIKITTDTAEVKSGAYTGARTITTLNKNDVVANLGTVGNWYVVRIDNRQIGCINTSQATPVVKEGQDPPKPLPTQNPPREEAPPSDVEPVQNLSSMEQQMVKLVNSARADNGLTPYKVDSELARVARIKAGDMVKNNYFSHYSPTYGSPFDMMDHYGIEYLAAGENLAGNQSVQAAHNALMKSTGHRQNILSSKFTHIGIGIKKSDKYGYIFVQQFIGK